MAVSLEETSKKINVIRKIPSKDDYISPIEKIIDILESMCIHCRRGDNFEVWNAKWGGDICLDQYNKILKRNPENLTMTEEDLKNIYERIRKGVYKKRPGVKDSP